MKRERACVKERAKAGRVEKRERRLGVCERESEGWACVKERAKAGRVKKRAKAGVC